MNLEFSGIIGFDPFVRVFRMSDPSPAPILRKNVVCEYVPSKHKRGSSYLLYPVAYT